MLRVEEEYFKLQSAYNTKDLEVNSLHRKLKELQEANQELNLRITDF